MVDITPDLAAQLAALERAIFPDQDSHWSQQDYLDFGARPGALAIMDAAARGFATLQVAADEVEILSIGVLPQHRRHGVARALLQAGEAAAANVGANRVFLEVAQDNQAALGFYTGAGYRQAGCRPAYYLRPDGARISALILAKAF